MELRCNSKILHGVMDDDHCIEVTCRSRWCGKRPGVVVVHKFNVITGALVETKRYSEPGEEESDGTGRQGASVRSA